MSKIENYVTSVTDQVYAIKNVPTEVVGTVFAKVSRSPKSFRDNLEDLIAEDMLALPDIDMIQMFKKSNAHAGGFMKKWGVDYGHSSIKEHAFAQLCIEGVSRWFTELLETTQASKWLSFTEFSLRYQKPQDYVLPSELDEHLELKEEVDSFLKECFVLYEELVPLFIPLLRAAHPELSDGAIEKLAYENARNILPLATKSNVAITGNARAISDCISELLSHEGYNEEAVMIAKKIRDHATEVLPSLISHTEATSFLKTYVKTRYEEVKEVQAGHSYERVSVETIGPRFEAGMEQLPSGSFEKMNRFSEMPQTYRSFGQFVTLHCSEGCHHQLLRHRAFDFRFYLPNVSFGWLLPEIVVTKQEMKEAQKIKEIITAQYEKSVQLYEKLVQANLTGVAPYVVLNATMRRVDFFANYYGLSHFITLRSEEYAQDEIRDVAALLRDTFEEVETTLPNFEWDRHLRKL
ncbi:FAD-dependent thymidylate synthase [Massilibacterium senegalense]|uniref:FAD-dependent thymidylate synthase n=1 Tax=Massilibacterium senegalense TaxID=1632858 RepID=UPI0007809012|nr:FAD-dependent thymidylate synthase [Massilibacterium senegalense]